MPYAADDADARCASARRTILSRHSGKIMSSDATALQYLLSAGNLPEREL